MDLNTITNHKQAEKRRGPMPEPYGSPTSKVGRRGESNQGDREGAAIEVRVERRFIKPEGGTKCCQWDKALD